MKTLFSSIIFIILAISLAAQEDYYFQNFIDKRNKKAFDTYYRLEKNKQNEIFSPYILDFSFSEIYLAADRGTATQISNVEQFDIDKKTHIENFSKYQRILNYTNSLNTNLKYSVNLFYPDTLKILKKYIDTLKTIKVFDSVRPYDATKSKDQTANLFNSIIEANTLGEINNVFEKNTIPDKPNLIVSSAASFSGHWANNFTNYIYSPFILDSTHKAINHVKYLTTNDYFKYGESSDYQIIQIPYEGYRLSLVIILPKKDISLKNASQIFNFDSYKLWREQTLQTERIRLLIPEFTIQNFYSLKKNYSVLMPSVFKKGGNFLNMVKSLVYVSGFYHYSKFTVSSDNENLNELKFIDFSKEKDINGSIIFNANHPFLFFLIDKKTNAILFIGHFNNPNEKE